VTAREASVNLSALAMTFAGALAAFVPSLVMWGFTVDDALIPLRYAHHLASGEGYRFDVGGPSTDGVTPLPWAFLLAPLASGGDLVIGLERVKVLGVVAWTVAGMLLGHRLGEAAASASARRRALVAAASSLVVVALAFQIGAWAASGMETGAATALATFAAVSFDRPRRTAIAAGLAATLRPELVVWAMVVAAGSEQAKSGDDGLRGPRIAHIGRAVFRATSLAFAPFAICTIARAIVFGRPTPLSVLAKPSDLSHGLVYGSAAAIVLLTPLLSFAPLALFRAAPYDPSGGRPACGGASGLARTLVLAGIVHLIVVVAVGGDWMPYARLMVPVAPGLALAFVDLVATRAMHAASALARVAVAVVLGACVAITAAPDGRHVHADRKDLIARARPLLATSRGGAARDIGWVGAANPRDAVIVDLAGLTDPSIAMLSGGHTSKNVDLAMLLDRNVDTIIVYSELRRVEQHLVRSPLFAERFQRIADVGLGSRGASYAIYRRR
jgi:hypothetical protein